ncbi:MAG: hypothetical protein LBM77_03805 [Spirochaetaceae bacterium]|jgi:hypothetical protein|nr:hypothetical protein [Spirochaetaceae bacterium]
MKKSKSFIAGIAALLVGISFMLTACPPDGDGSPVVSTTEFVSTNDGWVKFKTNDPENFDYSFWRYYQHEGDTYELEVKKISGASNTGYGMIFCADNNSGEYYLVMITTTGYYRVAKRNSTEQTTIDTENTDPANDNGWTESDTIEKGYNKVNKIKVVKTDDTFILSFNDEETDTWTDSSYNHPYIGPYVAINNEQNEDFPDTPVEVYFK